MANDSNEANSPARGGAQFPTHDLEACVGWAEKLVAKTHSGPQTVDIVYAGVVGAKGWRGRAKLTAMRHFGLLQGENTKISASSEAKVLVQLPEDEKRDLLCVVALKPKLFSDVFSTFHGDEVSQAKVRQRFLELNVHPEKVENCVSLYAKSLAFAGLLVENGDQLKHVSISATKQKPADHALEVDQEEKDEHQDDVEVRQNRVPDGEVNSEKLTRNAMVQVSLSVDSSLDTEKLEKQLQLLKKYGAL